jgi:hypothetical protein
MKRKYSLGNLITAGVVGTAVGFASGPVSRSFQREEVPWVRKVIYLPESQEHSPFSIPQGFAAITESTSKAKRIYVGEVFGWRDGKPVYDGGDCAVYIVGEDSDRDGQFDKISLVGNVKGVGLEKFANHSELSRLYEETLANGEDLVEDTWQRR